MKNYFKQSNEWQSNIQKNLKNIVYTVSLGGLLSTWNIADAQETYFANMTNNAGVSAENINWKICYPKATLAKKQKNNAKSFTFPLYNLNSQYWLLTEWQIAYAGFTIYDNRWKSIYFWQTDWDWQLRIEKDALISNLKFAWYDVTDLDNYEQIFTIKVTWGTIKDANKDFCYDKNELPLNWVYSTTWTIKQLNNSTISSISTMIENIVNWPDFTYETSYISQEQINPKFSSNLKWLKDTYNAKVDRIITWLNKNYYLKDVNFDWVVDNYDLYNFSDLQFATNKSLNAYDKAIKSNNSMMRTSKVNQAKSKMNLVLVDYETSNWDFFINLDSYMQWSQILYSYSKNFKAPIYHNSWTDILLWEWQTIYIKEKYSDINKFGTVDKLQVKNGELYRNNKKINAKIKSNNDQWTTQTPWTTSIVTNNWLSWTPWAINNGTNNTNTSWLTGNPWETWTIIVNWVIYNSWNSTTGNTWSQSVTNPIINNWPWSYTNNPTDSNTQTQSTIPTIDQSLDTIITQINNDTSISNAWTNLQNILGTINTLEKQITDTKAKIATNTADKAAIEKEITQLNTQITTQKQNLANTYNSLDNNARILLEPWMTTAKKQEAVNNITNWITTNSTVISNKTADTVPLNIADLPVSIDVIKQKVTQLTYEVHALENIKNNLYTYYQTKKAAYDESVRVYNQYMNDRVLYQNVLNTLNTQTQAIKDLWTVPNLYLNVWYIISNYSITTAINSINDRFNQYSYPDPVYYLQDSSKTWLRDITNVEIIKLLWHSWTISIDYSWINNGFPAYANIKLDWSSYSSITLKNSQHVLDYYAYAKKLFERRILLIELNKILPTEKQKNDIASRVLDYSWQYKQITVLWQDYYLSAENDYQKASAEYNNANTRFNTRNNLLNGYENLLNNYWLSVNELIAKKQVTQTKNAQLATVVNTEKQNVTFLAWQQSNLQQKQQEFSVWVKSHTDQMVKTYTTNTTVVNSSNKFADYPWAYFELKNWYTPIVKNRNHIVIKDWQKEIDNSKYEKNPYTIYIRFNIYWNWNDYPAKVWVDYKRYASDNIAYQTEYILINSKEELEKKEAIIMLVKKAVADINVRRSNAEKIATNHIVNTTSNAQITNNRLISDSIDIVKKHVSEKKIDNPNYITGFSKWAKDATEDSVDAMIEMPNTLYESFKSYWNLLVESIAFWEAKTLHWITNDPIYAEVRDRYNDEILNKSVNAVYEIEQFNIKINYLRQNVAIALEQLKYVENWEYWWGYINWYLDVLVTEWVAITAASRNAVAAMNALRKTVAIQRIEQILAKINTAWEIYKLTFKKVDLTKLSQLVDEFGVPYWAELENIMSKSYYLANKYWLTEEALIHIIYGEWRLNWSLEWWLHSMQSVSKLLKSNKIQVWYNPWTWWEKISYESFISIQPSKVSITNDLSLNTGISRWWWWPKTLFSLDMTDENIAQALEIAQDNIVKILTDLNIPKTWTPWSYWKDVIINGNPIWYITETITLPWKNPFSIKIWWKYDDLWNLDYNIITIFPN